MSPTADDLTKPIKKSILFSKTASLNIDSGDIVEEAFQ